MQLSWTPTAQFAGYLVADAKGFYDDAGLDVTVIPGGPNVNNIQQLVSGEADLAVDRISTLYQSRDKGIPIKAIAEFDQESGFWLVAKKSNGFESPEDLVGERIGVFSDNEFEYEAMLHEMGIDPEEDVETFYQGFTIDPWLNDEYQVAQMTAWNELQVAYQSGLEPSEVTTFRPSDYDVGILHGSLLATEELIDDGPEALAKFVDATIKGWLYAYEHPKEAVDIVAAAGQDVDRAHESRSLAAMKELHWGGEDEPPANWGEIDLEAYERNAEIVEEYADIDDVDVEAAVDTSIFSAS